MTPNSTEITYMVETGFAYLRDMLAKVEVTTIWVRDKAGVRKVCNVSLREDSWVSAITPDSLVLSRKEKDKGRTAKKKSKIEKKMHWIDSIKLWIDGGLKIARDCKETPTAILRLWLHIIIMYRVRCLTCSRMFCSRSSFCFSLIGFLISTSNGSPTTCSSSVRK